MNSKKAKKLKKMARAIAIGKPIGEADKIYKRLKSIKKK
jgi:hypothetical protein